MRRLLVITILFALIATNFCFFSCSSKSGAASDVSIPDSVYQLPDTLTIGILYSPTGFFILRGDTLGYDYERIHDFARDHKVALKFKVAGSMRQLMTFIDNRQVDILAVEIPETAEYKTHVLNCGTPNITYQVLVQPTDKAVATDVTQLVGTDIYVIQGSQYEARLRNLDSEIGGGINIHTIDNDTIIAEDLIDMVANGKLPMTIVDSDIAQFNATYYDDNSIDINLRVSFAQRSSWAVSKDNNDLANIINRWARSDRAKSFSKDAKRRYFELSKSNNDTTLFELKNGDISPYDSLFHIYAPQAGVNWMMLAAICKVESGFNNNLTSWAGARGIMQVMPSTARAYGFTADDLNDPKKCIDVASQSLSDLKEYLKSRVPDEQERQHFIIAAYNSGIGHIIDAIALAKKYGRNPEVWYDNVEEMAIWKSRPEYYNDPVCKYGYFRAKETVEYVKKVEATYNEFQNTAKKSDTKNFHKRNKKSKHKHA